ncbi:MAG TPA: hypothetical protein VFX70_21160, partial [Mycobacteriales bacterium]|nr:hypothetical protein [Mycobacteriales bacterium]
MPSSRSGRADPTGPAGSRVASTGIARIGRYGARPGARRRAANRSPKIPAGRGGRAAYGTETEATTLSATGSYCRWVS